MNDLFGKDIARDRYYEYDIVFIIIINIFVIDPLSFDQFFLNVHFGDYWLP